MGKSFYFQRNPLASRLETVEMEEFGDTQMLHEHQSRDPESGATTGARLVADPQAIDPDDNPTYLGDRLVPRGEEHEERDGRITQVMERVDDNGRTIGTYEMTWEKTGDRQMTHTKTRRIFT